MFNLTTKELEAFIADDIPYFDLTTHLQAITNKRAKLTIFTREDIILSCIEEAYTIAKLYNCHIEGRSTSGDKIKSGEDIISIIGDYNAVHQAWRNIQIILEYSSKIATYTYEMKKAMCKVNSHCELLATRKSFPFAKRFCIKSIMVGGAMPHRLGLSESILLFDHHRKVYKSDKKFYSILSKFKQKAPEKKIIVESSDFDDAVSLMNFGADVIQLDKVSIKTIEKVIDYKEHGHKHIKILVAGGINKKNVKEYAALGVDGIVTSALYNAGVANLGSHLEML